MATLQLEQAALMVNRTPEAIERWILDGRVDAERSAGEWLIDTRSLLNASVSEDVAVNGNGHGHVDAAVTVPVEQPAATSPNAAGDAARPSAAGGPTAGLIATAADAVAEGVAPRELAVPAPPLARDPTVEIATAAISALNARLEQAITEVERLQDERLKLALQLGYSQSQLKQAQEQLRMLAPPAEPNPFARWWRRLVARGERDAST